MIGLGKVIEIKGQLYEVRRTLPVSPGETLSKELTDQIRIHWKAEKVFKGGDVYYFVDEIQDVEWEEVVEEDTSTLVEKNNDEEE